MRGFRDFLCAARRGVLVRSEARMVLRAASELFPQLPDVILLWHFERN